MIHMNLGKTEKELSVVFENLLASEAKDLLEVNEVNKIMNSLISKDNVYWFGVIKYSAWGCLQTDKLNSNSSLICWYGLCAGEHTLRSGVIFFRKNMRKEGIQY